MHALVCPSFIWRCHPDSSPWHLSSRVLLGSRFGGRGLIRSKLTSTPTAITTIITYPTSTSHHIYPWTSKLGIYMVSNIELLGCMSTYNPVITSPGPLSRENWLGGRSRPAPAVLSGLLLREKDKSSGASSPVRPRFKRAPSGEALEKSRGSGAVEKLGSLRGLIFKPHAPIACYAELRQQKSRRGYRTWIPCIMNPTYTPRLSPWPPLENAQTVWVQPKALTQSARKLPWWPYSRAPV